MGRVSRWAVNRPVVALIVWFLVVIAIGILGTVFKGTLNDTFSLPNTQSDTAQRLLAEVNPEAANTGSNDSVVWSPATGLATDSATKEAVGPMLTAIAAIPSVDCVVSPYGDYLGPNCTKPVPPVFPPGTPQDVIDQVNAALAASAAATSPVSTDGKVAYATVQFAGSDDSNVPQGDIDRFISIVSDANNESLQVGGSGQIYTLGSSSPPAAEAIGIGVAIIILLIAFGSLIAAGLPIIAAIIGLAAGQLLVLLLANTLDVATFAPELAAMIGLGVGIDYALFILSRFRGDVQSGVEAKQAALNAVGTAGRAVAFAGTTVMVALLGLFVLKISFFYGLAIAAAIAVLMVLLSALFMLAALLSLLGTKALGVKMPWARHRKAVGIDQTRWAGYGGVLQKAPWAAALLALVVVGVLAIPAFSLQQGFPDNGSQPPGTPMRIGFDLMSEGFGPGINGPYAAAITLPKPNDYEAVGQAIDAITATPGVASTIPNRGMLPLYQYGSTAYSEDGIITTIIIYPTTAPQDEQTAATLKVLRDVTAPQITQESGAQMFVGGTEAVTADFTQVLVDVLPLFLSVVIGLGFIALMVLFRSLLIPLTAAITSLLSFVAALGVTVAVFQWGWGANLLGLSGTGPIFPFLPVMVFAILFGLSMDYQVFLVSRMQEAWRETGDSRQAVRHGLGGSGRVVVSAALIMISVFLAFVPTPDDTIKIFGVALASAVIVDAFVIRLVLIPAFMSMTGKANWWIPKWLDRILPKFSVE